ncbi:BQ2448_5319 [Microbotryum intermedium]|uniref:Autophagy-related protein 101 n=1 Tax=Microbotryum intermedium TaxID=269621 RepID=A0A238F955_9BASI|nr:BQ2448_5319 [Microbotryum intermedium]
MSSSPAPPAAAERKTEVFQVSLSVERQWAREVAKAILGTILFHRVLGNLKPRSVEVCGVTFPSASDPEIEALINAHIDTYTRTLLERAGNAPPRPSRMVICFYRTPQSPQSFRSSSLRSAPPPTGTSGSKSTSPSRNITAPVTSALGWFSASAKAALVGGTMDEPTNEQVDDVQQFGTPWEAWIVEMDAVGDGRRGVGEDRLRSQLNDFLLRSLTFVMEKTAHIPPITSSDTLPHGVLIGIDPPSVPFTIPQAIMSNPTWPCLHRGLVASPRSQAANLGR